MRKLLIIVSVLFTSSVWCQPIHYTVSNAHSHNDYEQKMPFNLAYTEGFGSIEADIFLENDNLYIAHDTVELKTHRSLQEYYIEPLIKAVNKNKGFPFSDSTKPLQLLIDIKTDSIHTLNKLVTTLQKYPILLNNRLLMFVITGNRPDETLFTSYPSFISFDGELFKNYSKEALTRIRLLSDNFKSYSNWDGTGTISTNELAVLKAAVKKAHELNKPVRFWNCPDVINAWKQFMSLGVDFINTDHINALSTFLRKQQVKR